MDATKSLYEYIKSKGINVAALARRTGIPQQALYESFSETGTRKIKADELLAICADLEINPMSLRGEA